MATQTPHDAQPSATLSTPATLDGSGPSIDLFQLLLGNVKWLVGGLCVGIALGILAYLKLGPTYDAKSQILVSRTVTVPLGEDRQQNFSGERSAHVAIIMSPMIVGQAVEDHQLDKLPSLAAMDDPVQSILGNLKAARSAGQDDFDMNVLNITYKNRRKEDAIKVVNAIAAAYNDYLTESRRANSREVMHLVAEASQKLSQDLAIQEKKYQEFREQAPLHWKSAIGSDGLPGDVTNEYQERLEAVSTERSKIQIRLAEMKSKMVAVQRAIDQRESEETLNLLVQQFLQSNQQGNQTVVNGSTGRQLMEAQLIPLLLEEKKLTKSFGGEHPDVLNVQSRIRTIVDYYKRQGVSAPDLTSKVASGKYNGGVPKDATMARIYTKAVKQQIFELENRDQELEAAFQVASQKAKEYSRFQLTDQAMSDELNRTKTLHNAVVKRLDEMNILKDDSGYRMQQISPAIAELDVKRIIKVIGGASMLGFCFAFGLVYLNALRDTTLKTLDDVRHALHASILGSVPEFSDPAQNVRSAKQSGFDPMLYYFHQPGSVEAEAYRSVRTTFFVKSKSENAQVVQVTSAEPGDGKTTTVSNLAIAAAQSGKKVLLIDADLRRPTVHQLFGIRGGYGFSEVLSGQVELSVAFRDSGVSGLTVVTAGQIPGEPAELLSRSSIRDIVEQARNDFDLILIDTPPLLAVSDPCIIAPHTDGIVLVVRLNKNHTGSMTRVQEMLDAHGMKLLGAVANGNEQSSDAYRYSGEYASHQTMVSGNMTSSEDANDDALNEMLTKV